jgi:hypothetical protein
VDPEQTVNLSISIESNLAALKRIVLADNFSKEEEREHIIWDLSQSMIEPVNQFEFFRTENQFTSESSKDYLTIAIPKKIITFFKQISQINGYVLSDVSVNQLVAEIALKNVISESVGIDCSF